MSKLINKAVTAQTVDGLPVSLFYKQHYSISHVQEHWRECGQWWLDEPELHVYKVVVDMVYGSFIIALSPIRGSCIEFKTRRSAVRRRGW